MKFSELAAYLDQLEATNSRNELVRILSELYRACSTDEIEPTTYLIQGRLAPFFEPVEIGLGERLLITAMATAYGMAKEDVTKAYRQSGDLGLTAQALAPKTRRNVPSAVEVHRRLWEIAGTSGEGSLKGKIDLFAGLLKELDASSAKHLVRITVGKMRLGIGDPTVLDALSFAKQGDRSLRPVLEAAYNRTSDLGLIARTLWARGVKGMDALKVTVGKPLRSQLAERLPNPEAVIKKLGLVGVQPKYDGFRVQIHKNGREVSIFSRNLETMTPMFPELVDDISRGLEGVVAKRLDSPYQAGARNFNWVKLKRNTSGELTDTIDVVLIGYYRGKGKRAEFGAGALLAGVYDSDKDEFVTISKLGTGLSDQGWRDIHRRLTSLEVLEKPARVNSLFVPDAWLQPELVAEVLADEITPSPRHTAGMTADRPGYALRFPRIVSLRTADKKPEDATSVREIREMFNQQRRR